MLRRIVIAGMGLFLLSVAAVNAANTGKVLLSQKGKPLVCIVKPADGTPAEMNAVDELSDYLNRITGGTFSVVEEKDLPPNKKAIYVGNTGFAQSHGINAEKMGKEESVLRTVDGNLILAGGRPRGTLYTVYIFLEDILGCRWYTPWYEKVPVLPTCSVTYLDKNFSPAFASRDMYTLLNDPRIYTNKEKWGRWVVKNRLNGFSLGREIWYKITGSYRRAIIPEGEKTGGGWFMAGPGSHSFAYFFPAEDYFEKHPEYFSERRGKRVPSTSVNANHLCLTNPDVLRIMTEKVLEEFKNNPDANVVAVAHNDGGCDTFCDCEKCREFAEKEGESGLLLAFVNKIAETVEKEYPGKYILTLAYSASRFPPKNIKARGNVIVYGCFLTSGNVILTECEGNKKSTPSLLTGWSRFAGNIWAWDYVSWGPPYFSVYPVWYRMQEEYRYCKKIGVQGILAESEVFVPARQPILPEFYEMRLWLMAKLMQDPDRDIDALIKDFMYGYYGTAGQYLYRYASMQKQRINLWPHKMVDYSFIRDSHRLFDLAEKSVKGSPEMLERVKDARIWIDITSLYFRRKLVAEFMNMGNKPERYPYKTDALKNRVMARLTETQNPLWQIPYWRAPDAGVTLAELAKRHVMVLSEGPDYCPLPEEFGNIPFDRILDLPVFQIGKGNSKLVPDAESVFGFAISRENPDEMPMGMGVYDLEGRKNLLSLTLKPDDIPASGYHIYKLGRTKLTQHCYVWFTNSWQIQHRLEMFFDITDPDREWDVYVSLKFTGPAYPHGKESEKNALFLERIILIKVANAKTK